ncbi:hypothetical protein D3C87_1906640 [compost metagenome]
MPLLTQFVHDVDNVRTYRHKDRLPAVGKLFVAQRQIHFMAHRFCEGLIADFTALMLMKRLAHGEVLLERRQRDTAEIAPRPQHPIEIDINDDIS